MTGTLNLHDAGPGVTVQDLGRPGLLAAGLSRGGALDRLALLEATALLALPRPVAALEMQGLGATVSVSAPTRIALTGAPMQASLDGRPLRWTASHLIRPGEQLRIGGANTGTTGYLTFAGGIATDSLLGSRSVHLAFGLGRALTAGDRLPVGADPDPEARALCLPQDERFNGGSLRVMPGPQTDLFDEDTRARFAATVFRRSPRGNRQGVRLDHDGAPFASAAAAGLVSDPIGPGDIQMTGDGVPFVLLAECQTIGGYPRIGTVLPDDLPRMAQAAPGAALRIEMLTLDAADAAHVGEAEILSGLRRRLTPLTRHPADIPDLLAYQLISGVSAGDDLEQETA